MTIRAAFRRLIEGKTRDDKRLRVAIVISAALIGVWLGIEIASKL